MDLARHLPPLAALTDETRLRLLCLLDDEELSVAEMLEVIGGPQSRVSTHLGKLREAGLVCDRAKGVHRYYRLSGEAMPAPARAAWEKLREFAARDPAVRDDRRRRVLLRARRSPAWVDRVAGSLERTYSPGRNWEALSRGLLTATDWGCVADIGAGEGVIAELIAPAARRVTCFDLSSRMVLAGRERVRRRRLKNVVFVRADMHTLPAVGGVFDTALLNQSLQYARHPERALAEVVRVLRRGGRLVALTLASHRHAEVRASYGHLHLGFAARDLVRMARAAGLGEVRSAPAGREQGPPHFEALTLSGVKP